MPTERLKQFLDEKGVRYETIRHATTYTAQRTAESLHVHGNEIAKTTVVKVDGKLMLAILPAPQHVDLERLRQVTQCKTAELAAERDFQGLFPGCEIGAMPPFGNLYGLTVWVDESLARDPSIVFNAGTHSEALRMDYADFERLVQPRRASFAH